MITPPRREHFSVNQEGLFSQRMINYLEDLGRNINSTTESTEVILEDLFSNSKGVLEINELSKNIKEVRNNFSELQVQISYLSAIFSEMQKRINDIENLLESK